MRRLVLTLTFLPLLISALPADSAPLTVRLLSWQGEWPDLQLEAGATTLRAPAGEFVLGPILTLAPKPASLRLFRAAAAGRGDPRLPVAETVLPPASTCLIAILAPAPAGSSLPLVCKLIDDSSSAHPEATVRLLNLSTRTLALRMAGKTAQVAAGGEALFPFPAPAAARMAIELAIQTDTGWEMVRRSLQPLPRNGRVLCLVREGRPTVDDPAQPVDAIFLVDQTPPL